MILSIDTSSTIYHDCTLVFNANDRQIAHFSTVFIFDLMTIVDLEETPPFVFQYEIKGDDEF